MLALPLFIFTCTVAALALQALKALYACPSIFKVERLALSSWLGCQLETCMPESKSLSTTTTYVHTYKVRIDPQFRVLRYCTQQQSEEVQSKL